MALVVEVKERGVRGAAVKDVMLRGMYIHRSGTNKVKVSQNDRL